MYFFFVPKLLKKKGSFFIHIFAAKLLTKGSLCSLKTKNEIHAKTETIFISYV